jgi:carbon-monoxide dehydrogenase iron sulfur subunit
MEELSWGGSRMEKNYVLSKPELCTGCKVCELACSMVHDGVFNPEKARLTIYASSLEAMEKARICVHCEKPPCQGACPVDAISKDPKTGWVLVDVQTCTGCGDCVKACPFEAMHLHPGTERAINCDLCGGDPQCVAYCRPGALLFRDKGASAFGGKSNG